MTVESSLAKPPFNLSSTDVAWVRKIRDGMKTAQKIRQLFVHITFPHNLDEVISAAPAGYMPVANRDLASSWNANRRMLEESIIPPFLAQDMEGGGNHRSALTDMPNQLAFAAVQDMATCETALDVMAKEAAALGFNWSFTPCIDINAAFQSAIVGTRSYGSNVELIARHALLHMQVLRRHGIATAAKHWPGEGYDERDQHLVTTVNPLAATAWRESFGRLYGGLIKGGLLSVMSAHIALPSYAAEHGVPPSLERYRPASLSRLLNETLLRGELAFNGLIVSDATAMAGLTSQMARADLVPNVIASGCDIFLFSTNIAADIAHMENGLRNGVLSEQRLEDAVTRILGMKAAIGLHKKPLSERLLPIGDVRVLTTLPAHKAAARAVADKSVTLIKDSGNLLPLNLKQHRRITWIGRPAPGFLPAMPDMPVSALRDGLRERGFVVSEFDPDAPPTPDNTDCVLYVLPSESSLGKSRIYLDWLREQPGMASIMARYWHDIPTAMVSFGHPYYLYDAPRIPCMINAYSSTPDSQLAVLARLLGQEKFEGVSPVDAFAGAPEARY